MQEQTHSFKQFCTWKFNIMSLKRKTFSTRVWINFKLVVSLIFGSKALSRLKPSFIILMFYNIRSSLCIQICNFFQSDLWIVTNMTIFDVEFRKSNFTILVNLSIFVIWKSEIHSVPLSILDSPMKDDPSYFCCHTITDHKYNATPLPGDKTLFRVPGICCTFFCK